jgi:hypothetical protein
VVYASNAHARIHIIPPQGRGPVRTASLQPHSFSRLDYDAPHGLGEGALLVADTVMPPLLRMPTLLVASSGSLPSRAIKRVFDHYSEPLFMPVPSEEELLALRAAAFPKLDEAAVRQRMELWGPIPRLVLDRGRPGDQAELWRRAKWIPMDAVVNFVLRGNVDGDGDTLVHERARGQDAAPGSPAADPTSSAFYMRGAVVLASRPLLRHAAERLAEAPGRDGAAVVDASVGVGALAGLRGLAFADVVLGLLERGHAFECRRFSATPPTTCVARARGGRAGGGGTRVVPAAARVAWPSAEGLAQHRGAAQTLLVPTDRASAGLDGLFWDERAGHHWPLACAAGEEHGVHGERLARAVGALGWTPRGGWRRPPAPAPGAPPGREAAAQRRALAIKVFWAVPEERFNHPGWAGWWREGADEVGARSRAAAAAAARVEEHLLCVPTGLRMREVAAACEEQGVKTPDELVEEMRAGGSADP